MWCGENGRWGLRHDRLCPHHWGTDGSMKSERIELVRFYLFYFLDWTVRLFIKNNYENIDSNYFIKSDLWTIKILLHRVKNIHSLFSKSLFSKSLFITQHIYFLNTNQTESNQTEPTQPFRNQIAEENTNQEHKNKQRTYISNNNTKYTYMTCFNIPSSLTQHQILLH